jgi:hypothetical protein
MTNELEEVTVSLFGQSCFLGFSAILLRPVRVVPRPTDDAPYPKPFPAFGLCSFNVPLHKVVN